MTITPTTPAVDELADPEDILSGTYWLMRAAGIASEVLSEATLYEAAERLLTQVSASMGFGPQTLTTNTPAADVETMGQDDCGAWEQWQTVVKMLVPDLGDEWAIDAVPAPACLDPVTCSHCSENLAY